MIERLHANGSGRGRILRAALVGVGMAGLLLAPASAQPARGGRPPVMPSLPPRPPSLPPRIPTIPQAAPNLPRGAPVLPRPPVATPPSQARGALNRPAGLPRGLGLERANALAGVGELAVRERELVRAYPQFIDVDPLGAAVVKGEVVSLSPSEHALGLARAAGFSIAPGPRLEALDMVAVVLSAPAGVSSQEAVARLRRLDPEGSYEFNHVYFGAGSAGQAPAAPPSRSGTGARAVRVGLVDGGVAANHPALAGAAVSQRGFAPGGAAASAHGTAVASLLVGSLGRFRGAAPNARLYAADVYGSGPTGGSAAAILRALAWMAEERVPVVNISLVGPPNRALEGAVKALARRGHLLVAAVGNDGPAAPPRYPAAYPETVGVTAVDRRGKALLEAGRGDHVDFSAPGADMAAAGAHAGFVTVRGTSYAAPIVAGRLALHAAGSAAATPQQWITALEREALDLGAPGRDSTYGRGLVGEGVRVAPSSVPRAASRAR